MDNTHITISLFEHGACIAFVLLAALPSGEERGRAGTRLSLLTFRIEPHGFTQRIALPSRRRRSMGLAKFVLQNQWNSTQDPGVRKLCF